MAAPPQVLPGALHRCPPCPLRLLSAAFTSRPPSPHSGKDQRCSIGFLPRSSQAGTRRIKSTNSEDDIRALKAEFLPQFCPWVVCVCFEGGGGGKTSGIPLILPTAHQRFIGFYVCGNFLTCIKRFLQNLLDYTCRAGWPRRGGFQEHINAQNLPI